MTKKKDLITVYVRVLPKVHKKLATQALKRGVSLTQVIREALEAAA